MRQTVNALVLKGRILAWVAASGPPNRSRTAARVFEPAFRKAGTKGGAMKSDTFIGIDVSKSRLDVAVYPSGQQDAWDNDDNGIEQLVGFVKSLSATLIVAEATGGYE